MESRCVLQDSRCQSDVVSVSWIRPVPAPAWRCILVIIILTLCIPSTKASTDTAGSVGGRYANIQAATSQPLEARHEYIVVGGGTAGCALAATLSQNFSVLLLERGGTPYDNPSIQRLEGWGDLLASRVPKNGHVDPVQAFRSADGVQNKRARVLGGGSAINAGFYSRASSEFVDAVGWDSLLVNQSYEWVESMVAFRPPLRQWQTAFQDGLVEAGITPNNGRTFDHLVGTKVGGSIFDHEGNRHSAADLLQYADGERLTVVVYATVQRIVFKDAAKDSKPSASGVVYTDAEGAEHWAFLEEAGLGPDQLGHSEVILTAGALGSPQLLLLSGVGPAEHLASLNIPCVVNLRGVGHGMVDNPINAVTVPSPVPVEVSLINVAGISEVGSVIEGASGGNWTLQWPMMGELDITPPPLRTDERDATVEEFLSGLPHADKQTLDQSSFILAKVYKPLSRGKLKLTSTNINDDPHVRFNYYSHPKDIDTCIRGVEYLVRLLQTSAFAKYRYTTVPPVMLLLYPNLGLPEGAKFLGTHLPNVGNVSEVTQWCRDTVSTIWHFHGGCRMGTVVDREYRVRGVKSLRVVDGSTFHASPGHQPPSNCHDDGQVHWRDYSKGT